MLVMCRWPKNQETLRFYVEFYATWTDDGNFNTVISSTTNGINIAKTGYDMGKIRIDVAGVPVITSVASYDHVLFDVFVTTTL